MTSLHEMSARKRSALWIRLMTTGLLVAGGCGAVLGCSGGPERGTRFVARGDRYVAQRKYAEAIIEYRNAVQADPRAGEAYYKLAEAYLETSDLANASRSYTRAADLMPTNVKAQLRAGEMSLAARQFAEARGRAEGVLKSDPRNVAGLVLKGQALAGVKNLDAAIMDIEEALRLEPERSRSYSALATLQLVRGKWPEAEAAFLKAVEIDPKFLPARLALAYFFVGSGQPSRAEAAFKEALQLDPKNLLTNRALALFAISAGRPAEAEPYLKTIASLVNNVTARLVLADYYIMMRRFIDASAVLERLTAEQTGFVPAKVRLGAIAYVESRTSEARVRVDEALARAPDDLGALVLKARIFLDDGRPEAAVGALKTAISAHPKSSEAHAVLGRAHAANQDLGQAASAFLEALKLNPHLPSVQVELARVELARGNAESAVQYARQAIGLMPEDPDVRLLLARGLLARGDLEPSERELKAMRRQYPTSPPVHTALGELYARKGDHSASQRAFDRALQLDATNLRALNGRLMVALSTRRSDEARSIVESQLAQRPTDAGLLLLAGRTFMQIGDLARAEQLLRRAVEADSSNLQAYLALGRLYHQQDRLDAAIHEYEEAAKRDQRPVAAYTIIGMIWESRGKTDEAQRAYQKAIEVEPAAAVAANNLAWLYAESGQNLDVALQLAQTAKSQMPEEANVDDTLGWILYKKNLPDMAVPPLERSVAKDPKNPLIHFHLGMALLKLGERERARDSLRQAIALSQDFPGAGEARRALAGIGG